MARIQAAASAAIDAPAGDVYAILADYPGGHHQILPKRYFTDLSVERGGTGAGTVVSTTIRTFGSSRTMRMEVSEPVPGRVLAERDLVSGAVTTFTVEPADDGRGSLVRIVTEWESPGLRGQIEKLMAPPMLRRIYAEELQNLQRLARQNTRAGVLV
jgi:hypothetical protein